MFNGAHGPLLSVHTGKVEATDAIGRYALVMGGNVFLTLIAIWLVDRAGRRPLWLTTSAAMVFPVADRGVYLLLEATP